MQIVAAGTSLIPPHLAGYACDVICHHLRQPLPSYKASKAEGMDDPEHLAMISVVTLLNFLDDFKTSDVIDTVRLSLKSILRWLLYFNKEYVGRRRESESGYLADGVAGLLYFILTLDKTFEKAICTDFSMIKFISSLWLGAFSGSDCRGFASRCLTIFLNHSSSTASTTTDVLCSMVGIPDVVSSRLLEDLLRYAPTFEHLDVFASVLNSFCTKPCEVMEYTFYRDQAVIEVCHFIDRRLGQVPPPGNASRDTACLALSKLANFVMKAVGGVFGQLCLGEAFHGDFLKFLVELIPLFDEYRVQSIRRSITKFLSRTLPRLVVQRARFETLLEAVQNALQPRLRSIAMTGSFSKEWQLLELLTRERAVYKVFYDRKEDLGQLPEPCANVSMNK